MCRRFDRQEDYMTWLMDDYRRRMKAMLWGEAIGKPGRYLVAGYPVDPVFKRISPSL